MAGPGRPEPADLLTGPFTERVLEAVSRIPPGRVMTYGDVAEYIGSRAPRAVGQVLARYGAEVPWWRVLRATGEPTPSHPAEALRRLRAEHTPMKRRNSRIDLALARWDGRPPGYREDPPG